MAPKKKLNVVQSVNEYDLGADLNGSAAPVVPANFVPARAEQRVVTLDVGLIDPNPDQPRKTFHEGKLKQLGNSIRKYGQLQPVVVVRNQAEPGRFYLVAGERRWRSSMAVGLTTVKAIIESSMDDVKRKELALIENVQRENLSPLDTANAYSELMLLKGMSQAALAEEIGVDQSTVSRALKLLELPVVVQQAVENDGLEPSKALLMKGMNEEDAAFMVERAKDLTRDQITTLVKKGVASAQKAGEAPPTKIAESRATKRALATEEHLEDERPLQRPSREIEEDDEVGNDNHLGDLVDDIDDDAFMHGALDRNEMLDIVLEFDFMSMGDHRLAVVVEMIRQENAR